MGSDSSSSSDSEGGGKKWKKEKKDKKHKDGKDKKDKKDKDHKTKTVEGAAHGFIGGTHDKQVSSPGFAGAPAGGQHFGAPPPFPGQHDQSSGQHFGGTPGFPDHNREGQHFGGAPAFPNVDHGQGHLTAQGHFQSPPLVPPTFEAQRAHEQHQPPPHTLTSHTSPPPSNTPPSGFRVPLDTKSPFPGPDQTGQPPCFDADGVSPIFLGSALMQNSVHPCKIGPHLQPFVAVAYGGGEMPHHGRYDLLPFIPTQMEWVRTSYGRVPPGRRPIEGGYEEHGGKLYHGLAHVNGVRVPGKCGEHLNGCNVSFGGGEYSYQEHDILCWK